jgi:hypothetical protein
MLYGRMKRWKKELILSVLTDNTEIPLNMPIIQKIPPKLMTFAQNYHNEPAILFSIRQFIR